MYSKSDSVIHTLIYTLFWILFPIEAITEYWVELPVLYNRSILVIYFIYGSVYSNGNPLQYSCLENPMDEGAWWAAVHGVAQSWTRLRLHFHFSLSCIGEGNGNPLQCSCLENPRAGGASWADVYGVTQSRTRLKWLSSSSSSSVYRSILIFQFIPPCPYPLVTIILFSTSITLFCR